MAKLSILAGATSQSVNIFVQDSSKTDGSGLAGLVFNTAGLAAYYTFNGTNAAATAITLATLAAVNSAFSSGGFKEIDPTNMPGLYRLDIPNAALVTAKGRSVVIMLRGATNMAPVLLEVELTGWDNQLVPGAAGGMFIAGANAATSITGALTANVTGNLSGSVGSVTGAVGSVTGAVGSVTGAVGSVTGAVGSVTGAVGSVTGNVGGNVTGSIGSLAAAAKTDVSTAVLTTAMTESYPVKNATFTLAQALYNLVQHFNEMAIVATTLTMKKRDQSTTAKTFTLDSAVTPAAITEAT